MTIDLQLTFISFLLHRYKSFTCFLLDGATYYPILVSNYNTPTISEREILVIIHKITMNNSKHFHKYNVLFLAVPKSIISRYTDTGQMLCSTVLAYYLPMKWQINLSSKPWSAFLWSRLQHLLQRNTKTIILVLNRYFNILLA